MKLRFRPHHFLCTLGFEGKGYSPEFTANYVRIADSLKARGPASDKVEIEVAGMTDSICGPCPSRRGDLCATQSKIEALDSAHARVLGIQPGDRLTWGEAKARIAARFTDEAFETACEPCGWKKLGYCKSALLRNRGAE